MAPTAAVSVQERIQKLNDSIAEVEISVKNRDLLWTVALQNPSRYHPHAPCNRKWKEQADADKYVFNHMKTVLRAVDLSNHATFRDVPLWEHLVKCLLSRTLNQSDIVDRDDYAPQPGVFTDNWSCAQPEGSGPGLDELVDPLDAGNVNPEVIEEGAGWGEKYRQISSGSYSFE
jgi:hypothetical protein